MGGLSRFSGYASVFAALLAWGGFSLYWAMLYYMPVLMVAALRIVWSWVFIVLVITVQRGWSNVWALIRNRRVMGWFLLSALLINFNWSMGIVAMGTGHIVESSMGQYINPLISTALGAFFFGENMRLFQKGALVLTIIGVAYMIVGYGDVPYFAILPSLAFGLYGTIHKVIKANIMDGMFVETSLMVIPAYLFFLWQSGVSGYSYMGDSGLHKLLIFSMGPVTMLPLMGFIYGVKRLPLTTVGILQYISPTLAFLIGYYHFHEPLSSGMPVALGFIWVGVVVYMVDAVAHLNIISSRIKR
ncbi:EamA family transporter RarD [Deferribacterales bacterium RsTz2092]